MSEFEKAHKTIRVKFNKGQYKAILDLAKAFKMKPNQVTVSLAMIGAVGWLVCGCPKMVPVPELKRKPSK